jgi:hypothetical protein
LYPSRTGTECNGGDTIILSHTINLFIGLNIKDDNSAIQQSNSHNVNHWRLRQASDGRSHITELVNHLVCSDIPNLHCALAATHKDFVEIRAWVKHRRGRKIVSKLNLGIKL